MNNFYIYQHVRLDTNTIFYVGKGKENRANCKYYRNKYWNNITNKINYVVEIIEENLTEQEAFKKEIELIKSYKEKGWCEANLTDGGEGVSGWKASKEQRKKNSESTKGKKHSEESKRKRSLKLKGRKTGIITKGAWKKGRIPWNKGIKTGPQTKEQRKKNSESKKGIPKTKSHNLKVAISKGAKPFLVYKKDTNELIGEWINQSQCARDLNISNNNVNSCLNHEQKSSKGYIFKYKE